MTEKPALYPNFTIDDEQEVGGVTYRRNCKCTFVTASGPREGRESVPGEKTYRLVYAPLVCDGEYCDEAWALK